MATRMAAIACVAVTTVAGPVAAQDDESQARQLFAEGENAVAEGRLAEAKSRFEASLRAFPTAAAAYNLALTTSHMGELLEARRVIDELLDGHYGPLPADRRTEVEALRRDIAERLARIRVQVGSEGSSEVFVDGRRVGTGPQVEVEVDPGGDYVVRVQSGDRTTTEDVRVSAGEIVELEFDLRPIHQPPDPETQHPEPSSS
ncbi:MAG: hypothetical protein AAGF12_40495, partial [Myxococcota bacterium]